MNLDRYIQGIRKGRDINYLEREAMLDSFLADALEGYDQVKGEHLLRINEMKKQILQQTWPKTNLLLYWSITTIILGIMGIGIYFLQDKLPFSTNDFITQYPEVKVSTNTSVTDPKPVHREIADSLQRDSLPTDSIQAVLLPDSLRTDSIQSPDYFFNKRDTSFSFSLSSLVATSITDSLLGPLIIRAPGEKTDEKPDEKPEITTINPKPAVGYKEYESYLRREMIRPVGDDCENVRGKVVLSFSINGNGRPYDISVIKSLCPSADAEAVRLLKEGPGWISGDQNALIEVRF
jgi:hypothetical protein